MWKIKKFEELSSREIYEILKLRIDTFVVEQKRIYHELDKNDLTAFHIFYQNEQDFSVQAYSRIFKTDNYVTFGRVVTSQRFRGHGLGKKLLEQILIFCQQKWPNEEIIIHAQIQVVDFYKNHGFIQIGKPFEFNLTPHVEMMHKPTNSLKIN